MVCFEFWSDPFRTHPRRPGAAFETTRYFLGKIFPGESLHQVHSYEVSSPKNIASGL